ncbi:MAG: hypothetical protein KGM18_00790 [Sphingomonadales bacterium]|nr:hypothetical protein [Sphingomonadales bacterium]
MNETIHDRQGRRIGSITHSRDLSTAYSWNGVRLGYYRARENITYRANGMRMGQGNLLSALIWEST